MRRGITLLVLLFAILISMQNKINFVKSKDSTIPEEAIRLRIVANSNSESDQELKLKVRDEIINIIYPKMDKVSDRDEARKIVYDSMEEISAAVKHVLEENGADSRFTADYGRAYFPDKSYNNKVYPAGMYESVYIVLGDGAGENWWCVLFPPLCLVDVASDNTVAVNDDADVRYSFLIVEKLKELFGYK